MQTDALVDRLIQDLRPIRRRSLGRDVLLLLTLALVEAGAFLGMGFARPDMPMAMQAPSFWWKLASMALIAVLSAAVAVASVDPVRASRRGLRWVLVCIAAIFASGWLIDASDNGFAELFRRLAWTQGLQCVWKMAALSIPSAIAFGLLIRRGAPTDRSRTALAAGLSSATWGALIFVLACPSDDPLYIAVWYTIGCAIVTGLSWAILLRLSRW